jgi:hypothetical protein
LPLKAVKCSVLPLARKGAQFCHYIERRCYGEAKRPSLARFRPVALVRGWVQILHVGPGNLELTGGTGLVCQIDTLTGRAWLTASALPCSCDTLRRHAHPCSRDHLPRRPLLGRPLLEGHLLCRPLLRRHLLRRYCDATLGVVVPPVRPPRARRNGERQR